MRSGRRKGNAALIIGVLIVAAGGAVYMSPDLAEDVLPPSMLAMHPQFETVETDRSCGIIQKGTELVNSLPLDNVTESDARAFFCRDQCGGEELVVAGTCTSDQENTLNCVCRKPEKNGT